MLNSTSPQITLCHSCLVLGEEPIVKHCVELLLSQGHSISFLVTENYTLQAYARGLSIPVLSPDSYVQELQGQNRYNFDLIVSITFPRLIPNEVLALAKIASMNFHDGLLPAYAGMNCTAWAIHNNETQHGITWHAINEKFDDGEIFKSAVYDVSESDTAIALHMKNSALALTLLEQILNDLQTDSLQSEAQSKQIKRNFYALDKRPQNFCVIDWSHSCEALIRLANACDFGDFDNTFGSAKLLHNDQVVLVKKIAFEKSMDEKVGAAVQETRFEGIHSGGLAISHQGKLLVLSGFSNLRGKHLSVEQAVACLGLNEGQPLTQPTLPIGPELSRHLARNEIRYSQLLQQRKSITLPFEQVQNRTDANAQEANSTLGVEVVLPKALFETAGTEATAVASMAWAILLSSLVRQDEITLSFSCCKLWQHSYALFSAKTLPLTLSINSQQDIAEQSIQIKTKVDELAHSSSFLTDLIARTNALQSDEDLVEGRLSGVGLSLSSEGRLAPAPENVDIYLSLSDEFTLVSPSCYSQAQVETVAARLVNIAEQLNNNTGYTSQQISVLSSEEIHQIVYQWNATETVYSDTLRLHDYFEQQVLLSPQKEALLFNGQSMSYEDLHLASNKFANSLHAQGIGVDAFVGVLVDRGFNLIIALLGIIKSGAAYVPIDTQLPGDRIKFIVNDANCALLVVSNNTTAIASDIDIKKQLVDELMLGDASAENVRCQAGANDICYAIYTSGSTGQPKGVLLTHTAVINTLEWVNKQFGVSADDRLLFVTSPSFDLSVYDIFGILAVGGSIDIASEALLADPEALVKKLTSSGVTIWDSAPPALARLADYFPENAPQSTLRLVMMSGDWIPVFLPTQLMEVFPKVCVKSLGGATEAAIWSNYYEIESVDADWKSIPYGRPIQNARYYILDQHLRPLPAGVPGNLYIGGVCLAQGYLNRAELTKERFINDPFIAKARIYKTGDLCRFWADGTMEFLGREDFQVKIRGYRIELGEIEAALINIDQVQTAYCIDYIDATKTKALAAYVKFYDVSDVLSVADIKDLLAQHLPSYMVPTALIVVNDFPLTANGKLDRARLPSPTLLSTSAEYAEPTSELEKQLLTLWCSTFGREKIGIHDDFFELGGHSLMAVKLINELNARFQSNLPLSVLLDNPSVQALAQVISKQQNPSNNARHIGDLKASASLVRVLKPGGSKSFYLIYDGDGEILLYMNLAKRFGDEYTVYGVLPPSSPGIPLNEMLVSGMARVCVEQILQQREAIGLNDFKDITIGGLCAGGVIAFEMVHQLEQQGKEVENLVLLDAFEPTCTPNSERFAKERKSRIQSSYQNLKGLKKLIFLPLLARKVWNAGLYTIKNNVNQGFIKCRLNWLNTTLKQGKCWPSWLKSLELRDIYAYGRDLYRAPVIACHNVILVKATADIPAGDADEPNSKQYLEKDLGWQKCLQSQLVVIEVEDGHSSMLQEPKVEVLYQKLVRSL